MTNIPANAMKETWDSVYEKSVMLAERIAAHCAETGERFDAILVVPRGSYYPVNIVARELGFGATDLLHACVSSYMADSTARTPSFSIGQMPSAAEIRGKHLLIIEEVCDTGHTLDFLTKRFKEQGAALIRTGVLHYKPSKSETEFVPDWFVTQADDSWIVYPWEEHEQRGKQADVKRVTAAPA